MAYTYFPPNAQLAIYSFTQAPFTIDSTPAEYDLLDIPAVAWTGTLIFAQMDIYINGAADTSGALNYILVASPQIKDTGGTWRDNSPAVQKYGMVPANSFNAALQIIPGYNDLKSYIASDTAIEVRLRDTRSLGDDLTIIGCYPVLRLYFEV